MIPLSPFLSPSIVYLCIEHHVRSNNQNKSTKEEKSHPRENLASVIEHFTKNINVLRGCSNAGYTSPTVVITCAYYTPTHSIIQAYTMHNALMIRVLCEIRIYSDQLGLGLLEFWSKPTTDHVVRASHTPHSLVLANMVSMGEMQ